MDVLLPVTEIPSLNDIADADGDTAVESGDELIGHEAASLPGANIVEGPWTNRFAYAGKDKPRRRLRFGAS